jgi:hypothetical protein
VPIVTNADFRVSEFFTTIQHGKYGMNCDLCGEVPLNM